MSINHGGDQIKFCSKKKQIKKEMKKEIKVFYNREKQRCGMAEELNKNGNLN